MSPDLWLMRVAWSAEMAPAIGSARTAVACGDRCGRPPAGFARTLR
jgi:hypothetical protein